MCTLKSNLVTYSIGNKLRISGLLCLIQMRVTLSKCIAHPNKTHGQQISKNVMGVFSLGSYPRSLYLYINESFQVKEDKYMIVNHEENNTVSYLRDEKLYIIIFLWITELFLSIHFSFCLLIVYFMKSLFRPFNNLKA